MKITATVRQAGKWTFYDVMLASAEGREPFLTIKDCKLIEGSKGQFVGFPSRKDDKDKWWPMVYGSDGFQAEVIRAMNAAEPPKTDPRTIAERRPKPPVVDEDFPW
jgi:DNA-binding cell septation regulator SpoVG